MDQVEFTEILDHSVKTDRTEQTVSKYLTAIVNVILLYSIRKAFLNRGYKPLILVKIKDY